MSRITTVASARKRKDDRDPYVCYSCHEDIAEGTAYAWTQPSRYSARINWHATCPTPPGSMMEANEKRAAAMAAFENGYDAIDELRKYDGEGEGIDTDEFVERIKDEVLNVVGEGVREAAELWRESASNIEDGFGHSTSMSEEFESNADEVESIADEVEGIEPEEYEAEQYNSIAEWIDATLDSVVDELGSIEGNLP
jgi:hypothetical protein